uniref:Uncharacterized protein n=1 Tax=Glossina austeni TaxID=7395 RepID=A0A1A9UEM2_GLOAU
MDLIAEVGIFENSVLGLMLVSDSDSQCPPPAPALLVVPVVPPADLLLLRPPSDRPDFFLKISTTTGISLITGQIPVARENNAFKLFKLRNQWSSKLALLEATDFSGAHKSLKGTFDMSDVTTVQRMSPD